MKNWVAFELQSKPTIASEDKELVITKMLAFFSKRLFQWWRLTTFQLPQIEYFLIIRYSRIRLQLEAGVKVHYNTHSNIMHNVQGVKTIFHSIIVLLPCSWWIFQNYTKTYTIGNLLQLITCDYLSFKR